MPPSMYEYIDLWFKKFGFDFLDVNEYFKDIYYSGNLKHVQCKSYFPYTVLECLFFST